MGCAARHRPLQQVRLPEQTGTLDRRLPSRDRVQQTPCSCPRLCPPLRPGTGTVGWHPAHGARHPVWRGLALGRGTGRRMTTRVSVQQTARGTGEWPGPTLAITASQGRSTFSMAQGKRLITVSSSGLPPAATYPSRTAWESGCPNGGTDPQGKGSGIEAGAPGALRTPRGLETCSSGHLEHGLCLPRASDRPCWTRRAPHAQAGSGCF